MNNGPAHDLTAIKRLVGAGKYELTHRVASYLMNHGFDPDEAAIGVIEATQPANFHKSTPLVHLEGVAADVYKGVMWEDDEWYVKLFEDGEHDPRVQIWSMKEEGYAF